MNFRLFFFLLLSLPALAARNPIYEVGNRLHPAPDSEEYLSHVQPILSSRCVACHGCYETPCQLNLESYEGLRRGFHPTPIFAADRLGQVKPTRLIDASSVAEWRKKGFFPVVSSSGTEPEDENQSPKYSLLYQLLEQGSQENAPGFNVTSLADLKKQWNDDAKPQCVATADQWNDHFRFRDQNLWNVKYVGNFLKEHPKAGMPFGLPKLSAAEETTLFTWLDQGAKGPDKQAAQQLETPARPDIVAAWESFLNGDSAKAQQTARYIYEHVYTAHLYFEEDPGEFFELVRSRALQGAIDQVVTELPYDSPTGKPGTARVYYRLKKITRTIAQKTHFVWHLNNARLAHLKNLFLDASWGDAQIPLPEYGSPNPFKYFASIPTRIRSRFMIENGKIIVGAMTQGSVCVGSTATYAISDHFWSWFLKPESDPSVMYPDLGLADIDTLATAQLEWHPSNAAEKLLVSRLDRLKNQDVDLAKKIVTDVTSVLHITLDPATVETAEEMAAKIKQYGLSGQDIVAAIVHYHRTIHANYQYQEAFEKQLRILLKSQGRDALSLHDLWLGDGDSSYPQGNPNAWLNITRHGKSATVQYGREGGNPQSIWVMSYSNYERLYYNLVASYKEWGSVLHKMATWRHMSYVRLEGEDLAISFLPIEYRNEVRKRFTRGIAWIKNVVHFPLWSTVGMSNGTHYNPLYYTPLYSWDLPPRQSPYRWRDADSSIHYLVSAMSQMLSHVDSAPSDAGFSAEHLAFEKKLNVLAGVNQIKDGALYPQHLPNIAYIRVTDPNGQPWVYSLVSDRGYLAHNVMLAENLNRDPQYDAMTVYRGFVGSYPSVFLDVSSDKADAFLADLAGLNSDETAGRFERKWGVAPNSSRFWPFFDWLHTFKTQASSGVDPVEQGVVDLSQYDLFEEPKP